MSAIPILVILLALVHLAHPMTYSCDPNSPCGCSIQPATVSEMVGGEDASNQPWGWMVSILLNRSTLCGGSILSSSWVLTAAHCVDGLLPEQIIVSSTTDLRLRANQVSYASQVIVHAGYDRTTQVNDIALVRVAAPFNMTDVNIAKICLPSVTASDYPPTDSPVCFR